MTDIFYRLISYKDVGEKSKRKPGDNMQTVCFKSVDGVSLMADIYLPDASQVSMTPRPIGKISPNTNIIKSD